MALNAAVIWEVRTGGNDTNGGGFKAGASGTDWTLQDAAQYSVTDAVTNGTTTITSATANFGTDVVGNILYIQGGTGSVTAGWYEITSRTNSTTIVVDRSTGLTAGTGCTLKIGGALASPGQAAGAKVEGNDVFIKAGTYTLSTTSTNVAGGPVNETTHGVDTSDTTWWVGYDTNRTRFNADASRPVILVPGAGVSSITIFTVNARNVAIRNIDVDGASKTAIRGFDIAAAFGTTRVESCKGSNCTNSAFFVGASTQLFRCQATGCSTEPAFRGSGGDGKLFWCEAHDNTVTGFMLAGADYCVDCISESNSGASSDGFIFANASAISATLIGCTSYNNGRHGVYFNASFNRGDTAINCVAEGNGGYGFYSGGSLNDAVVMINCSGYNNVSGNYDNANLPNVVNFQALSGSPFTSAASADFSPNNLANAGASIRGSSFPTTFLRGTTSVYDDRGAVQHQDNPPHINTNRRYVR
jgi:hypothetical protein